MKKTILIGGAIILIIGAMFTSCKPTDNENIIGTWTIEQAIATNPQDSTTADVTEFFGDHSYQFKYAGGLTYTYFNIEENNVDTVKGNWAIYKDELMLTVLDSTHHILVKELTSSQMNWEMEGVNKWIKEIHHKPLAIQLKKQE